MEYTHLYCAIDISLNFKSNKPKSTAKGKENATTEPSHPSFRVKRKRSHTKNKTLCGKFRFFFLSLCKCVRCEEEKELKFVWNRVITQLHLQSAICVREKKIRETRRRKLQRRRQLPTQLDYSFLFLWFLPRSSSSLFIPLVESGFKFFFCWNISHYVHQHLYETMKPAVINNNSEPTPTPTQSHHEQNNQQPNNGQPNSDHSRRFPQFRVSLSLVSCVFVYNRWTWFTTPIFHFIRFDSSRVHRRCHIQIFNCYTSKSKKREKIKRMFRKCFPYRNRQHTQYIERCANFVKWQ